MSKLKQRFIVDDYDQLTGLELIYKLIDDNVINKENIEQISNRLLDTVTRKDLKNENKLIGSDFKGSWFGVPHPAYTEEGQPGTIIQQGKEIEQIKNIINTSTTYNLSNYGIEDGGDITEIIEELNNTFKEGDTLIIPNGTYITRTSIKPKKNMTIKGVSTRQSILKGVDTVLLELKGESILKPGTKGHLQGVNISDVSLYCQDTAYNIVEAYASSHITFNNVYFFGSLKSAVDCIEFFDVRWLNCWFYWCGDYDGNYPVINFRNNEGYEYNNNHYFYGCMFESNRGRIIKIDAVHNTEFKFVTCKFENVESAKVNFELKDCGAVQFLDCMFSCQGRTGHNFSNMISLDNTWGVNIQGSIYKWDRSNGGRENYSIIDNLIKVVNSRSFNIDLVLYNSSVQLSSPDNSYIYLNNNKKDGSKIRFIKQDGDSRKIINGSFTDKLDYNIEVVGNEEPFISVSGLGTSWQLGRLQDNTTGSKFRIISYNKEGAESTSMVFEDTKCSHKTDTFMEKGLYLGRYDNTNTPWGFGGCLYYDTSTNEYKVYIDGTGWKALSLK